MKKQRQFISLLLAALLVGQLGLVGVAAADPSDPTPSPTPAVEETASPSPTPSPSATPSPSSSPDPEPSASPSPSPEPSVTPSPAASPEPKKKYTDIGPDGCGGVIPNWVYDTVAEKWVAADKGSFTCDKATGYYLSPKYYFDKRTGWYKIIPPLAEGVQPEYMLTAPNVVHTVLGDLVVGSKDYEVAKALGLLEGSGSIVLSGTGPGSNNQAQVNNGTQSWIDLTSLVNVINTLQSNATSGGVAASSNTQVGNSATGAATVLANIINLLASAWSWSNGNLNFFMRTICEINKTCTGDLNLNPIESSQGGGGQLGGNANVSNTGPDSNNEAGINNASSLDVNAKNGGNIVNNVDLTARSGDADVNGNTSAGNVATGDAMVTLNIINLINSFINSGSSFFGILNIFGNFNGDILFPNGFLNGLMSSGTAGGSNTATIGGTGPGSYNQGSINNSGQANINNSSYNGVNNNINANATTGSANVNANSAVGDIATGSASTNQSLFNLSNSSIFGDNAVLVIVNVLGHWVGKIMTIPGSGATQSALLTGNAQVGVHGTGPDSNNEAGVNNASTANINQESVGTITNNVNLNAQSGDANVDHNTEVGDVSTGDAKVASSVANIFNSVLNVKHWFGVLVINVFGDWMGDVNHNSAAGTLAAPAVAQAGGESGAGATGSASQMGLASLFTASTGSGASYVSAGGGQVSSDEGKVLTAAAHSEAPAKVAVAAKPKDMSLLFGLSALVMLIAGALAQADRKLRRR